MALTCSISSVYHHINGWEAITQHGVRLALAEEDAAYLAREDTVQVHTRISASLMIAEGLGIESQQYVFYA